MAPLFELFFPELDTIVKYKNLSLEEGQLFCLDHENSSPEEYQKAVLEYVVFNLKTDVAKKLREYEKTDGEQILGILYNQAVMLNPGVNYAHWLNLSRTRHVNELGFNSPQTKPKRTRRSTKEKIARSKFLNLERHLQERVIGQDEAITEVVSALKRAHAGLQDPDRPLGVFLFAGATGVGKTHLAEELHKYLYDSKYAMVRVDCGEYQEKHENQKLTGAPPGYIGHDQGGQLTNQIMANPDTVLLIDEVEKAHPDMMNTFLRIFDEGFLTDGQGRRVSFRNTIIIMTTNLGNEKVVKSITGKRVGFGTPLYIDAAGIANAPTRRAITESSDEEIRKHFTTELLNRIDKIVVFNHLTQADYSKIADLELQIVQDKVSERGFSIAYDPDVISQMVSTGVNPLEGARKLGRVRRASIEDRLADMLIANSYPKGTVFQIAPEKGAFRIVALSPPTKAKGAVDGTQ